MLSERRARIVYDTGADVARLEVEGAGEVKASPSEAADSLLLDRQGALVGVDLGGDGLSRMVVMVGAHEDVAMTKEAVVLLATDARGEPLEIRIANARKVLSGTVG